MKIELVTPTQEHVLELDARMREGDRRECLAAYSDPKQAIWESLEMAQFAWTALNEFGDVVYMAGVGPMDHTLPYEKGRVFLLSTEAVKKTPLAYVRSTKRLLGAVLDVYKELVCYVDARYEATLRWLEWLGFSIRREAPILIGPEQVPFYPCTYRRA